MNQIAFPPRRTSLAYIQRALGYTPIRLLKNGNSGVTVSGGPGTTVIGLTATGVAAGTYKNATVTLGTDGRVTAATGGIWAPSVATPGRKPGAGEELFKVPMSFATTLPINLTGSTGGCEVAFTSNAVFNLFKNGSLIGTATIPLGTTGNNIATFSFSSARSFAALTDNLSMVSPAVQDATGSGVYFQFLGAFA